MNRQGYNQGGRDLAEAARGILIEMTGRARRADVMNIFADKKEQRVTGCCCQRDRPPIGVCQALRNNGKERHAKERSRRETDQRAKRSVRQSQQRADGTAENSEGISRYDLPKDNLPAQIIAASAEKSWRN